MENSDKWECYSPEWIHKVREETDKEISATNLSLSEWIKSRCDIDLAAMCKQLGLKNIRFISDSKPYGTCFKSKE